MNNRLLKWKLDVARRAREDKDLPTRHVCIRDGILAVFLVSLILFGDAIVDGLTPGRIDRHIAHNIDIPPRERDYMATREDHPHNVWKRICVDGTSWIPSRQRCE